MPHFVFAPATAAPDAGADIARQTVVTLARLDERLRAERSSLADAAVITVYLRRASDFPAMNEAYRQAQRQTIDADPQKSPNLSPAVRAGNTLLVSGLLAEGDAATADPGSQTRDIVRKLDALLTKAGFARADVRDVLVYVTDEEAAATAMAECRAAFGAKTSMTPVKVALAAPGARVEIMTLAGRG
jgi:enamine deaminase RidA (YjgF/YER057c/UK114 family)